MQNFVNVLNPLPVTALVPDKVGADWNACVETKPAKDPQCKNNSTIHIGYAFMLVNVTKPCNVAHAFVHRNGTTYIYTYLEPYMYMCDTVYICICIIICIYIYMHASIHTYN